jgi:hypothetical protein
MHVGVEGSQMFLQVTLHFHVHVGDKIRPALGRHGKITGMQQ